MCQIWILRPGLERPGVDASKESSFNDFRQSFQEEMVTKRGREFRRKNQKERKRRTIFITCERGTSQKKDLGEKEQKLKQKLTINLKERF